MLPPFTAYTGSSEHLPAMEPRYRCTTRYTEVTAIEGDDDCERERLAKWLHLVSIVAMINALYLIYLGLKGLLA